MDSAAGPFEPLPRHSHALTVASAAEPLGASTPPSNFRTKKLKDGSSGTCAAWGVPSVT